MRDPASPGDVQLPDDDPEDIAVPDDTPEDIAVPDAVLVESTAEVPMATLVSPYKRIYWVLGAIVATVLVAVAVFLAVTCTTGTCGRLSSSTPDTPNVLSMNTTETPTLSPTSSPTAAPIASQDRIDGIATFIQSITLSENAIAYPPVTTGSATPNELALQWLIEDDPLQVNAVTSSSPVSSAAALCTGHSVFSHHSRALDSFNWVVKH